MNIKVASKVDDVVYTYDIDDNNEMAALHKAIVLGNPPRYCDDCKNNQSFKMDSNKDKDGNVYVNVVCKKCGAKAKLGLYKSGGYFWHKFEKWEKKNSTGQATDRIPEQTNAEPDDAPF